MACNCNEGKTYNIGMGCCVPVLAPIENYYTKSQVDELIEGIEVSGVTEEEVDEKILSAKTEIEAEIPTVPTDVSAFNNDVPYLTEHQSLSGYATEQWVEDKHYITGVDLSNYATKSEIPTVPTNVSAFNNDAGYLTQHQSLSAYSTTEEVTDLVTAATDDMATQTWVNNQGYLTEHQSLSAYSTTEEVNTSINQATSGKLDTSTFETYSGNVETALSGKQDASSVITYDGSDRISVTSTSATAKKIDLKVNVYSGSGLVSVSLNNPSGGGSGHNQINGTAAFGAGYIVQTKSYTEAAFGTSNLSNGNSQSMVHSSSVTLFSIGNGSNSTRHNAFEVRQNGDVYVPDTNASGDALNYPMLKLQDYTKFKIVQISQSDYDILQTKDSNTLYIITD